MSTGSRIALVTGATRGIGRATAMALADAGFRVAVLTRTGKDVHAVAAAIRRRGGTVLPIPAAFLAYKRAVAAGVGLTAYLPS